MISCCPVTSATGSLFQGATELYYAQTELGFTGDGIRYSVYYYDKHSSDIINNLSNKRKMDLEKTLDDILLELNVPEMYRPNFKNNYMWQIIRKSNDRLYIIYDLSESKLFLIQDIK